MSHRSNLGAGGGGGGGSSLFTLSDTSNTVVTPSSSSSTPPNNIQLIGGTGISVVSGTSEITFTATGPTEDLFVSDYIVDSDPTKGTHTTLAAALAVATNGQTISLKTSVTENVTPTTNVTICAVPGSQCSITGTITLSSAVNIQLANLTLITNGAPILNMSGAVTCTAAAKDCYFDCTNNTGITCTASGTGTGIVLMDCGGNIATTGITLFTISGGGNMSMENCSINNTGLSTTASTISAGLVSYVDCFLEYATTTSGTASFQSNGSDFVAPTGASMTLITHASNRSNSCYVYNGWMNSGSASAISIGSSAGLNVELMSINSTNTNPITGAGSVTYAGVVFSGSGNGINVTTQSPGMITNDTKTVVTPGAYPYTTISQDSLILVDSSAARTIIPLASPVAGQEHIIKDNGGLAATNNITVTPSGKNIDGSASFVMKGNYDAITIRFNGTQWNLI